MNETMIEKGFTEPTDRVKRLKKMIVEARPMVETYRAQLVTQTYKVTEGMTAIMRRAKVDENLFNNLPIVIRDEELIVGSPCVHPRSSDVGIEYSYADLANELETMQTRTCDQFDISEEDKEVVRHFDDYWKGHTMSDYAWSLMSPECQACQTHAVFNAGNYMYAGVGHVCCYYEKVLKIGFQGIIKEVLEMKSKTNKDMIRVSFDFAQNDSQPGYFEKAFRDDIRPDKKWPANGTTYILTEDQNGDCSKSFKTFITSVEKSNPGFTVNWGDGFAECFKNKLAGAVFGVVNDYYNGRNIAKHQLRWFRSAEGVKDADIPAEIETKAYKDNNGVSAATPPIGSDGFMDIPDGIDEELPFN